MRKMIAYLIIVLLLGCVLGFVSKPAKKTNPVASAVMDMITLSTAYADSDTVGISHPKPPPIK